MHRIPRASVIVPRQATVLAVDFPRVCLLLCPTHSYELTFAMDIGQIVSTSRVIFGILCIVARNFQKISPCSGLKKKSAYISLIGKYFRGNYPFSILSFITNHCNRVCFVWLVLDFLPFFSMSIALTLSWWTLSSSTAYTCPSMKYIDHRHCVKASYAPTILASVELFPFIFCPIQ